MSEMISSPVAQAAVSAGQTDPMYRKIAWRLIPLLIFVFILAWIDRVNIGFAKLQMLDDLHFSEAVYGLGAGIFFIGYFLFEVPSNLWMDRIGARKTLARITILWGVVSILMMFVTTPMSFYVLRFLLGVCEAGFFPGVILYLTYWFPAERRAKVNGLFMTSFAIAGAVGGPIAGWIMSRMVGVGGLANWQWLFLLEGIPSVLTGFFVIKYLPEKPARASWLDDEEKRRVQATLDAEDLRLVKHSSFGEAMRQPKLWLCAAIFFCLVAGNATLAFWVPSIIKELGIGSVLMIGMLSAVPFACGAIAMVINGGHSDKTGERRLHCAIAAIVASGGLALTGATLGQPMLAFAMLTVAGIGVLGAMPIFWSFPAAFLTGTAAAGGIGLINAIANLAGFVAPYAIGYLKASTGSLASGLYFAAAIEFVGAILVFMLTRRRTR